MSPPEGGAEAAPPVPPTVTFVHASPSLSSTRLCWTVPTAGDAGGTLSDEAPFPSGAPMPASNFPGLPVGGAVQLSPATELAASTGSGTVDLYAIDAEVLALEATSTSASCEALLCLESSSANPPPACLRPNKDYWRAGTLPMNAIAASGPTFVALAGCLGTALDPAATAARCGSSWDSVAGNLHVEVLHVATQLPAASATLEGGVLSVQSALLSSALATSIGDSGAVRISFGAAGDASAVALLSQEGDVEPGAPAALDIGTDLAAFGQLGFGVDEVGADAAGSPLLWTSLAQAQSLVEPTADPRVYFGARATYVALVVGDPAAPSPFSTTGDAAYDGRGLHVLVLASLPAN